MKKDSSSRIEEWRSDILGNNKRRLSGFFMERLFQNMDETLAFLVALCSFMERPPVKDSLRERIVKLRNQVRGRFLNLSLERSGQVVSFLYPRWELKHLAATLFGCARDNGEPLRPFLRLLDLFDFHHSRRPEEAARDLWASRYREMWVEMITRPSFALRVGGLDVISIAIPELQQLGYQTLTLYPQENFPDFTARFERRRQDGSRHLLDMRLTASELSMIFDPSPENARTNMQKYMDALLAFVAVFCAWKIIVSDETEVGAQGARCRCTESCARSRGGVVRPRVRHLPNGHRMSPEARARALATFRTIPLPGFTFVQSYAYGDRREGPNTSPEPVFRCEAIQPD